MPDTQRKINVAAAVPLKGDKIPMATPVPASTKNEVDEEVTVDRESYNELRAENIKLANRNRKLQNTIEALPSTDASASGQHATEITALKHGRAQANKLAKELEEKGVELRENNARLKADVNKLASQNAELSIKGRQDYIAAQNEKQKLEAENEKHADETKLIREKLEKTVGRRNAEQEEHTKLVAKLKAENKFLGEKLKKQSSTAADKIKEVRIKLESAQKRLQQLEKEAAESNAKLKDESDSLREQLKKQTTEAADTVRDIQKELEAAQNRIREFKGQGEGSEERPRIENDIPPEGMDQTPEPVVSAQQKVASSDPASDDPIIRLRIENQILHSKIAELLKESSDK